MQRSPVKLATNSTASYPDESVHADLDSRAAIEVFVDRFYARVLNDAMLAPLFLEVAAIDLDVHLPHIKDYWCKLLLQETRYQRHTMNKHRALHAKQSLTAENFDRWLSLFVTTVDASFSGPYAEKAKRIARAIAANMQQALNSAQPGVQSL